MTISRVLHPGLWIVSIAALTLTGCAEQERELKRLQQENASLEHDQMRLQREKGDCARELERAQKETAGLKAELDRLSAELKLAQESIAQEREAGKRPRPQEQALQDLQGQISARLMETERKLAEKIAQAAASVEKVKVLEEQLGSLSAQVEQLQEELANARRNPTTAPRREP